MQYTIHEGSIELPDALTDRTVNMLMTELGKDVSYTISRDKLQEGEDLEDFIARQLKDLARQVTKFTEQGRTPTQFKGSPHTAYELRQFFKQNGREFHQRQVVVLQADGRSVLIITGTAFNSWSPANEAAWLAMLKNSTLR